MNPYLTVLALVTTILLFARRISKHDKNGDFQSGDIVVISAGHNQVAQVLRNMYSSQRVILLSDREFKYYYAMTVDYSNLNGFPQQFEAFLAYHDLPLSRVVAFHSLEESDVAHEFSSFSLHSIDEYLQRNVYSHVFLANYFSKLASIRRLTFVGSATAHASSAQLHLYYASKAFLEQFVTGLILERPDLDVVCAVPSKLGNSELEWSDYQANCHEAFLSVARHELIAETCVAAVLHGKHSGIYPIGFAAHAYYLIKGILGTNLWARVLNSMHSGNKE